jgi:nucleoside phosphorylase
VLTVTLDTEYEALEAHLKAAKATRLQTGEVEKKLVVTSWSLPRPGAPDLTIATGFINGMGNAVSALETYILLQELSPTYVFLCGIAGSMDSGKVRLGDVVVSSGIEWCWFDKISDAAFASSFLLGDRHLRLKRQPGQPMETMWRKRLDLVRSRRAAQLPSNTERDLIRFREEVAHGSAAPLLTNTIHLGRILSWDYVLTDAELRDRMCHKLGDVLAVEMEGGGFDYAHRRRTENLDGTPGPIGFIVRGISDLAAGKDGENHGWRRLALNNAIWTIVECLRSFEDDFYRQDRLG